MPSMSERMKAALDLSRRLPPQMADRWLEDIMYLAPEFADRLMSSIDKPSLVAYDSLAGREYLLSEFNRDGDSFRSCWSNRYEPPIDDAVFPSSGLRALELHLNSAFESYKNMYFGGGVSSVYLWDVENSVPQAMPVSFNGAILMKKVLTNLSSDFEADACWDSVHVIAVRASGERTDVAHYRTISTALLWLRTGCATASPSASRPRVHLAGTLMKDAECDGALDLGLTSHVVHLGHLIEDMENRMRSSLDAIYFGKTREVLGKLRAFTPQQQREAQTPQQADSVQQRTVPHFKEDLENFLINRKSNFRI